MSNIEVVDFASLVADSAKLKYLEKVKLISIVMGDRMRVFKDAFFSLEGID